MEITPRRDFQQTIEAKLQLWARSLLDLKRELPVSAPQRRQQVLVEMEKLDSKRRAAMLKLHEAARAAPAAARAGRSGRRPAGSRSAAASLSGSMSVSPYAHTVLEANATALIVLDRCLEFRERDGLLRAYLGWPEPRPSRVILDLSRLERLNVVTISTLLRFRELLDIHGRSLSLQGLRPSVQEALRYLGLHRLMPMQPLGAPRQASSRAE